LVIETHLKSNLYNNVGHANSFHFRSPVWRTLAAQYQLSTDFISVYCFHDLLLQARMSIVAAFSSAPLVKFTAVR